ncbi:hypothetical protein EV651_12688 [Kribbella sp. VKM Ac-2571]|uniref:hypothetical protein n=1 Tax=Kribbella sp. VKM Ac-2571 TaxID=2512222 RepID=UPI00105CB314|nr:hypothetical protein [Kribbella sp. VKM Ac-2571]TDO46606.1 hypothetical protein EV651_12688 [Kribbella sp. VKM Ac-2571]
MSDWWTEHKQNQQLSNLESEMSYARQEASSLRSQLSRIQGSLQSRVDSLSRAFDAFVELSDLRHETAGFVDAAELRRYATRVLSAMASSTELPEPGAPVARYWLSPATQALISLHASTPDEQAISAAMELDQRRTSIYLSLALAVLGQRHQVQNEWLDVAFGVPAADGTLTRVQRVLWTTAARGGFGADGLELVVKRLQSAASPDGGWLSRLEIRGSSSRSNGPRLKATEQQDEAAYRLSRIRNAVETILGNTEAREPDPDLTYPETRKTDSIPDDTTSSRRGAKSSAKAEKEPAEDSAAAMLRLLISEGSEPERETLARIAVLRARVSGGAESDTQKLDDSAGTVDELLTEDLGLSSDPYLSTAALRVVGPLVLPAVETVAQTAELPAPSEVSVESGVHTITVRADGPDQLELGKATSSINASAGVMTTGQRATPIALLVVGAVVAIGLGLFLHWFWIVVGLVVMAFGLNSYVKLRGAIKADKTRAAGEITNLNERCTTAATALANYLDNTEARKAAIAEDLTTIRHQLTT